MRVRRRTVRGDEADRVLEVFHADRYAGERTDVFAGGDATVDVVGHRERAVGVDRDERVDPRVQVVDARERVLDEVARGDAASGHVADEAGKRNGPEVHDAILSQLARLRTGRPVRLPTEVGAPFVTTQVPACLGARGAGRAAAG